MKTLRSIFANLLVAILALGITAQTSLAQDTNKEAAEKFNEARAAYKSNPEQGLNLFMQAHRLAQTAGDKRTASMAIKAAKQLHYKVGLNYAKAENYAKALDHFNSGIELDPDYYPNYKGRALALKKTGKTEEAMEAYILAAGKASQAGKLEDRRELYSQAAAFSTKAVAEENWTQAIEYANMHLKYRESSDVYWHLALAHNRQGKYQEALDYANKALELSTGSRTAKAKIYFEIAEAHENMAQYKEAVDAYRQSAVGDYRARAEHKIEELGGAAGSN